VYTVFLLAEILHVELKKVRHHIVKHVEASSLLDVLVSVVHHVEDRREDFVHSLHVLYPWVQSCENEEDPCHVVVSVGFSQLLERDYFRLINTIDKFVFFLAGVGEERDLYVWGWGGEEGEL
jgi:hypothetical protein